MPSARFFSILSLRRLTLVGLLSLGSTTIKLLASSGASIVKIPPTAAPRSGKGSPEWWVANIKPGRVMFEVTFPDDKVARQALERAMHKLPMKCRIITRDLVEG